MKSAELEELKELRKLWSGFWAPRVVLTANNIGVFGALAEAKTAEEVATELSCSRRGVGILLDALAGLGLVRKAGGRYRNTSTGRKFLEPGAEWYQGDMIRHADILWQNWSHLDEVVKTGQPVRQAQNHDSFIRAMHNNSIMKAAKVVGALDLKGVRRALDLGGGPGTYSIEFAKRGLDVTLFDLPETAPIAREIVEAAGVRVTVREGDIFADDPGSGYDFIFISQLLHAFSPEDNRKILEKCRNALNPGGRIVIQEFTIDGSMTTPVFGALFAVNMLVNTPGGRCYPAAELKQLLRQTGFRSPADSMIEDSSLVVAMAPGKRG